ncbi:hypothetical protein AOQ84DRAFT_258516, partial [Glonium stellatum]
CGKCDKALSKHKCSCDERFCDNCFVWHQNRFPIHRKVGGKVERAWKWATGKIGAVADGLSVKHVFEQDEGAKWFGLHIEENSRGVRVAGIVETHRFSSLAEKSIHASSESPSRQFPNLISFVGDTGSGKSTLIRSLIWCSAQSKGEDDVDKFDAPVPCLSSGAEAMTSTTGEVNLYSDPATFGTGEPRFYVDCEGTLAIEPMASRYQDKWHRTGRQYTFETVDGKDIDRETAVQKIYPRFLYISSDVICLVTRNPRSRVNTVLTLLEWSEAGAHHTVNQYALPAAVIVLNAPPIEDERWVSDDLDALTDDFFKQVDKELKENKKLRKKAKKKGDETMKELISRNFSSIHVHYIPDSKWGRCST